MAFWLWILTVVVSAAVLLMLLVLLSRIRLRIRSSLNGSVPQVNIVVQALYGLLNYQFSLPSEGTKQRSEESSKSSIGSRLNLKALGRFRVSMSYFRQWIRELLKKIECTRLRIDFTIGLGDTVVTAVSTGMLWTIAGCASGAVSQFLTLTTSPQSRVSAKYSSLEFTAVCEADLQLRMGSIVWSFLKLAAHPVRVRNALRSWKSLTAGPREA